MDGKGGGVGDLRESSIRFFSISRFASWVAMCGELISGQCNGKPSCKHTLHVVIIPHLVAYLL